MVVFMRTFSNIINNSTTRKTFEGKLTSEPSGAQLKLLYKVYLIFSNIYPDSFCSFYFPFAYALNVASMTSKGTLFLISKEVRVSWSWTIVRVYRSYFSSMADTFDSNLGLEILNFSLLKWFPLFLHLDISCDLKSHLYVERN